MQKTSHSGDNNLHVEGQGATEGGEPLTVAPGSLLSGHSSSHPPIPWLPTSTAHPWLKADTPPTHNPSAITPLL